MGKILLIDTTSNKEIKVGIRKEDKEHLLKRKISSQKAQVVLPMIDNLLKKQKMTLKDLASIEVNTRPGSFTGIRVGMTIANVLALTLKIPVKKIK